MHCPGGNATQPIWRVLAFSQGISSWTPLKPQHSIRCWLSIQWEPSACQKKGSPKVCGLICSVQPSWVWKSQHASTGNSVSWSLSHSSRSSIHRMTNFPSLKQNFIAYRSSSSPDCIFRIHQLWQSGFSRVYSNSCCSCSFEAEIIKIGQSSHKMYSNNIVNFQEFTTILNARTKKSLETYRMHLVKPFFLSASSASNKSSFVLVIVIINQIVLVYLFEMERKLIILLHSIGDKSNYFVK